MKSESNSPAKNDSSQIRKQKERSFRPPNKYAKKGPSKSSLSPNMQPKNQKVKKANEQIETEEVRQIESDHSFEKQMKQLKNKSKKTRVQEEEEVLNRKPASLPNNEYQKKQLKNVNQSSHQIKPFPGKLPPHQLMTNTRREHEWNRWKPVTLLSMDAGARIQMWKRMPMKLLLPLRATCARIKSEIDHSVGISLSIDDRQPSFYKLAPNIGIQQMRIFKLQENFVPFLLHGILLKILVINGDISSKYAAYIFESCPNICHLTIKFTYLFSNYATLFPIQYPPLGEQKGGLPNMTYLRIECRTATNHQFSYALETLYNLIIVDLKAATLRRLHVSFHNEAISKNMESLHACLSDFVNGQANSLENLHISVSQDRQMRVNHKTGFNKHHRTSHRVKHLPDFEHYSELDSRSETDSEDMIISWNDFPVLSKAVLSVNKFAYFWVDCLSKASAMKSLSIDLKVADNWPLYIIAISASSKTLEIIQLHSVNRGNALETLRPVPTIDFSVFGKLKKLTRLTLECRADEELGVYYKVRNISSVCQVNTLELSWISLTPCQLSSLLMCSRKLRQLELSYCSISNCDFRLYFIMCRWVLAMQCSRIRLISILDNKLRFQFGKAAVKGFLTAQWRHTAYYEGFYLQAVYSRGIHNQGRNESSKPYTVFNDMKIENSSSDPDEEDDQ